MKKKITPSELAERLASQAQIEKSQAESFVRKFFELVGNGLLEDKYVKIKSFGTFKLVSVGERESININTGERFQISGHTKVSFSPDAALKELVNQPFAHFEAVDLNDETDTEELNTVDLSEPLDSDADTIDDTDEEEVEGAEVAEAEESEEQKTDDASEQSEPVEDQSAQEQEPELADTEIINLAEPSMPALPTAESAQASASHAEASTEAQSQPTTASSADESMEEKGVKVEEKQTVHEENASEDENSDALEEVVASSATESVEENASSSSSVASTSADEEEIEVSTPQPVTTPSGEGSQQERTSSSIAGYVYEEVPSPRKRNAWKYVALAFCALVLMGLCYFAGYFRVLCPECLFIDVPEAPIAPESEARPQSQTVPASPAAKADTASNAAQPAPSVNNGEKNGDATPAHRQTAGAQENAAANPDNGAAASAQAQTAQASTEKAEPQTAPAKPQTVKHTVKAGENLTRIVRRHYGSEAYVNKVVKHNHLKNADNVTVGTVIELPPFK